MVRIAGVRLPRFGRPAAAPEITVEEHRSRLEAAVERMKEAGLEFLIVYGDREHSANMAYLTGFDPRFEEAVLLLDRRGNRLLLVGNECMGYLPDPALGLQVELFQEFSLLGQPRGNSRALRDIFSGFGVGKGAAIGCVGWKYFGSGMIENPPTAIEIPSYLVDLPRSLTGDAGLVRNATALFMGVEDGLRTTNSADQVAHFEYVSICTSESVREGILEIREGVAETQIERCLHADGIPQSCHPMVSFGEKARRGLASPTATRARLGDAYTIGYGLQGALTSRAGAVAHGPEELAPELHDFYEPYVKNYFDVVVTWYHNVRVGAVAGEVFAAVEAARDDALYKFAVNPGHYLHLDEWVHSPFAAGSATVLHSGMALQMDIIPVSKGPFCYSNAEDGVVLADEALRAEISNRHPECWQRILARREFMQEAIGIALDESVLPLSNIPAWLPPYALAPGKVMVNS